VPVSWALFLIYAILISSIRYHYYDLLLVRPTVLVGESALVTQVRIISGFMHRSHDNFQEIEFSKVLSVLGGIMRLCCGLSEGFPTLYGCHVRLGTRPGRFNEPFPGGAIGDSRLSTNGRYGRSRYCIV
jgi:hypothetical protein